MTSATPLEGASADLGSVNPAELEVVEGGDDGDEGEDGGDGQHDGSPVPPPNRGKRAPVQAMAQSSTTMPGGGGDKVCGHCG